MSIIKRQFSKLGILSICLTRAGRAACWISPGDQLAHFFGVASNYLIGTSPYFVPINRQQHFSLNGSDSGVNQKESATADTTLNLQQVKK